MNDVSLARSPRWAQWLFVAVQAAAYWRPVMITAGRRASLRNAEAMVDLLHQEMTKERRTAPLRPTRHHALPGGAVRIEIDVRDEPTADRGTTQTTARDTAPSHRVGASASPDPSTGNLVIDLPDGWIESIGWSGIETVDVRVADYGSLIVSRVD